MSFGFCPECNIPAKRKMLSASCEKCGVALKASTTTTAITTFISLGSMLVAVLLAKNGTQGIIDSGPPDLSNALFWYYMKLTGVALLVSYSSHFIVYKWFTKYVPVDDNT